MGESRLRPRKPLRTSWPRRGRRWPKPRLLPRRMRPRLPRIRIGVAGGGAVRRLRARRSRSRVASRMRMVSRAALGAGYVGVAGTRLRGRSIRVMTRVRPQHSRIPMTTRSRAASTVVGVVAVAVVRTRIRTGLTALVPRNMAAGAGVMWIRLAPRHIRATRRCRAAPNVVGAVAAAGRTQTGRVLMAPTRRPATVGKGAVAGGAGAAGPVGNRRDRALPWVGAPRCRQRMCVCGC